MIEEIKVYTITGQLVNTLTKNTTEIDLTTVSEGLYLIEITTDSGEKTGHLLRK